MQRCRLAEDGYSQKPILPLAPETLEKQGENISLDKEDSSYSPPKEGPGHRQNSGRVHCLILKDPQKAPGSSRPEVHPQVLKMQPQH